MNLKAVIKNSEVVKDIVILGVVAGIILSSYLGYISGRKSQKQIAKPTVYNPPPIILLEKRLEERPLTPSQKIEKQEPAIQPIKQEPTTTTPHNHPNNLESKIVTISREIDKNYLANLSNEEYKTSQYIEYLKKEEVFENSFKIRPRREYEAGIAEIRTKLTALKNIRLIKAVDTMPLNDLKDYYKPLKELLNELNAIQANNFDCYEKLERIYEYISKKIKPGEITKGALGIEHLVNGKLGDCNDISAAYFALFNYYHINCYLKMGKILKMEDCHGWIAVDVGEHTIDLDPTLHKQFLPLKDTKIIEKF